MIFVYDEEDPKIVKEMWMVRGDDESISVDSITLDSQPDAAEEDYVLRPGDTLTLTVRATPDKIASPVLMQISSAPGVNRIPIRHEDTRDIPYGQYSADIELFTEDGYRKTIWPKLKPDKKRASDRNTKNFMICSEAT